MLALGAACLLVLETAFLVLLWPGSGAVQGYLLGLLHMGVVGAFAYLMHSAFVAHDREAILHVRGAWGEENTRSELQRARRKRLIWGWVDSLTLETGDIDHLVITRTGGLVAIDSKWRNSIDVADRGAMAQAAHKARLRAEGVLQTLHRRERGTHRAHAKAYRVTPLLVLWGASQRSVPDGATVDGIEVVGGRRLLAWLRSRDGDPVDEDAAKELLTRLEDFRAEAWKPERRSRTHD
jgi:hypothetical protein